MPNFTPQPIYVIEPDISVSENTFTCNNLYENVAGNSTVYFLLKAINKNINVIDFKIDADSKVLVKTFGNVTITSEGTEKETFDNVIGVDKVSDAKCYIGSVTTDGVERANFFVGVNSWFGDFSSANISSVATVLAGNNMLVKMENVGTTATTIAIRLKYIE